MTAYYPGSVRPFTVHTDVTDVIYAAHPNALQEEVTAIETVVGTSPQVSITGSSSNTYYTSSNSFPTVSARIANVENLAVADVHTQYIRKSADSSNTIVTGSSSTVGLVIEASSGQTANLQEWRDSVGGLVSYIDANGNLNGTSAANSSAGLQDIFMIMGA